MGRMTLTRTHALAASLALVAAPALVACGGSANAAHDACMGEAAAQAAQIEGVDPSTHEGDYDLMGLCDELVGMYDDEGRVVHTVGCIADYVGENITEGGVYVSARQDGTTIPDLMDDPFSVSACA